MYFNSSNLLRSQFIGKLITPAHTTGLLRAVRQIFSKSLTVVNYHRIGDPFHAGFDSFRPNISATPDMFNQQMDYLARWFNVISIQDILKWLDGKQSLPPYAALITFDDGYLDNYTEAYPILQRYNFPAIVFLTTNHIGTDNPFFWDLAAFCFHHTASDHVLFPNAKERSWTNAIEKTIVGNAWIESMKSLSNVEKQIWVNRLPEQLRVSIPENYFKNMMMNWDQVREMSRNGIGFGGHTMSHPILNQIPLDQAFTEIKGSKERIEKELGEKILSFAYPNGMSNNFNSDIELITSKAGYRAAFTLLNGPTLLREVKGNPYAIRRIFISHTHTLSNFAALTSYINRYRK